MSWRRLGASCRHLGCILDASWGKYRKKVEGTNFLGGVWRAKMEAKIIKICIKNATCFSWRFLTYVLWFFMFLKVSWWRHVSFFGSYFALIFLLIFCWSQIPRNLKNGAPVQAGALFLQNRCFHFESKNRSKKHRNLGSKIHENLNITFANLKWKCYIFEAKKPSKWGQKSLKIKSGQVS